MTEIPIEDLVVVTILAQAEDPSQYKEKYLHEMQNERMRQVARILMKDLRLDDASPAAQKTVRLLQTRGQLDFKRSSSPRETPSLS